MVQAPQESEPVPESYADYSTFGWSAVISWILNLKGFYRLAQSSGTHQMLVLFECSQFLSCKVLEGSRSAPHGAFLVSVYNTDIPRW